MVFLAPRWTAERAEPKGSFVLNRDSPQANGLVFWMPGHPAFGADDVRSGLFDRSLFYRRAAQLGATPLAFGRFADGTAGLDFDSASGISFAADPYLERAAGAVTVMARYRVDADGATRTVVGLPSNEDHSDPFYQYMIGPRSTDAHMFICATDVDGFARIVGGDVAAGVDFHVVGRFDPNGTPVQALFENGVIVSSDNPAGALLATTQDLRLGQNADGEEPMDGVVADVRVYSRALTDAEIWQAFDPATRFDLYYPLGQRLYFRIPPPAGQTAGTSAAALPPPVSDASGTTVHEGTSAGSLPALASDASGTTVHEGASAAALAALTSAASGTASHEGTSAAALPALEASSAGVPVVSGAAAGALPALTSAASGAAGVEIIGTSAAALPQLTAAASGTPVVAGASAAPLPKLESTSAGAPVAAGTSAAALPQLTAAAGGVTVHEGTSAGALPQLTAAAAGVTVHEGTSAAALPPLEASASGAQAAFGTSAAALPALVSDAPGAPVVAGTSAAALPALASDASGIASTTGVADALLPALRASATGMIEIPGTSAARMPALRSQSFGFIDLPAALPEVIAMRGVFDRRIDWIGRTES